LNNGADARRWSCSSKILPGCRPLQAILSKKLVIPVFPIFFINFLCRCCMLILAILLLPACVGLSNREDLKKYAPLLGVQSIAVFIQHWPVYLEKSGRHNLGEDFIKPQTIFFGPWQRASQMPPRALDIQDIDTTQIGKIVVRILEEKGYQVFLANPSLEDSQETVDRLMAQYQEGHPPIDAFLFCYFAPTLFVSQAREAPPGHTKQSYSLAEIVGTLSPATDAVIWVGQRDQNSPANSISHAFIYWAMTMFNATTGQPIMLQADSRGGGPIRPWVRQCPPAATSKNYPASAAIIRNLMIDNFTCRLRHEIPFAFNTPE
jgi:hypothetical protein